MTRKEPNPGVIEAIKRSGENGRPGSTHSLAHKCKVSQPAVMHWLYVSCPAERAVFLEKITGVPRSQIRPDIFEE